jgi:hypothetical protein
MTIEKFGMYDNTGDVYIYVTTNRYAMDGSDVRFAFSLKYEMGHWTDYKSRFTVQCLKTSDAPATDSQEFYSYEDAYDFILDHIIEYGNVDDENFVTEAKESANSIVDSIRANAEAILRNLYALERGSRGLDDYNASLLKKAKKQIIDVNSAISTVSNSVQ